MLAGIFGGAAAYPGWDTLRRQAEQEILAGNIPAAAERLDRIPALFRPEGLVRYTELCELARSGTEEACEAALEGIGQILPESSEPLRPAMQKQYDAIERQYRDLLYQTALAQLRAERFDRAREYLRQVPEYPHTAELLRYAQAGAGADPDGSSADLKSALNLLERALTGYEGPLAEEMAALQTELRDMIAEAEAREEAEQKAEEERIAALKASEIPHVGMPESEVEQTRQLGRAGYVGTESAYRVGADGKYYRDKWNVYAWYDTGGNLIFKAECQNGEVFWITKSGQSAWDGDDLQVELGEFRPKTFHFGGAEEDYDGDTGAGSGHSLREDYGSPEDLYEDDGTYSNLDEAMDEWEEGW